MAGNRSQGIVVAPVGPSLDNGYDLGGARFYPWSTGLALRPTSYYSDYIGPAGGLPVSVPAGSLPSTVGDTSSSSVAARQHAAAHPWGRTSPLPWVVGGLIGGALLLHGTRYKKGGD